MIFFLTYFCTIHVRENSDMYIVDTQKELLDCHFKRRRSSGIYYVFVLDLDLTLIDENFEMYYGADTFIHRLAAMGKVIIWTAGNRVHLTESIKEHFRKTPIEMGIVNRINGRKPQKYVSQFFRNCVNFIIVDDDPDNLKDDKYLASIQVTYNKKTGAPNFQQMLNKITQLVKFTQLIKLESAIEPGTGRLNSGRRGRRFSLNGKKVKSVQFVQEERISDTSRSSKKRNIKYDEAQENENRRLFGAPKRVPMRIENIISMAPRIL